MNPLNTLNNQLDILVVDDDPSSLQMLVGLLRKEGYGVRAALDGDLALRGVTQQTPDLILLDIMMLGKDGFEVCAELKQHDEHRKIPILFISGWGDSDAKLRAFEAGGVDYITKPFQEKEVLARVRTHLDLACHRRSLEETVGFLDEQVRERTDELASSEEKFRNLVEQSLDWIWEVNNEAVYTYASPQVEAILGYKPEEIIGKTPFDLMLPKEAKRVTEILSELIKSGKPIIQVENVNQHKDGRPVILETSGVSFCDKEGDIIGYRGIDRDITDRKQADEQQYVYERIMSATQDLMSFVDDHYVYRAVNDSYCKYHDLAKSDIVGKSAAELMGVKVFENLIKENLDRALGGNPSHYGAWFDYPRIGRRYMDVTYNPFLDINQVFAGVVVVVRDHTERKQAEDFLRESESQFRRLVEKSPAILYRYSDQNGGIYYSPRVEELLGYTPEYLLNHPSLWHDSIHTDDLPRVDAAIASLLSGNAFDIEYRICDAKGNWHWFHDRNIDIQIKGNEAIVEGLASDITDRKQIEEEVKNHRILLETIVNTMPDIICLKDGEGCWLLTNEYNLDLFELQDVQYQGKTDAELATYTEFYRDALLDGMSTDKEAWDKKEAFRTEKLIHRANGTYNVYDIVKTPLFNTDGSRRALVVAGRDITVLKKSENLLRQSKEEWEKTFNAMSDIITIQDKDMHIIRANKAAYDCFESDYGELVGKYCYEVFSGNSEPCPGCPQVKTLETIRCHSEIIEHKRLGKTFYVSSTPILDENNEIDFLAHIAKDITKQKRLEEELFQSHKMEAIGTMAGGIAHDFNNILSAIISFSQLAKQDLPADSGAGKNIDVVIQAGRRAAELVKQILAFSRKSEHNLQPLRPHLLAEESLRMLRSSLPSTIIIEEDIDKECGEILADPTNIHQIMMNLCTNALHAMEKEKGTLTVKLYGCEVTAEEVEHEPDVTAGPFVVLSIRDTGYGMDETIREHIFEPYFTTKETGKGTGMGLSVIHGITHDYNGFIKIESTPGEGSTFSVYIPALQEKLTTPAVISIPKSKDDLNLIKGTARILVVDDELLLVKAHKMQLTRLGYSVTTTIDSEDALKRIQSDPKQFDLLITDQTMPGLSGVELAKEVQKINPELPIILCTGHSEVVSREEALALGIKKYVSKPIYRDELSQAIREVLEPCRPGNFSGR